MGFFCAFVAVTLARCRACVSGGYEFPRDVRQVLVFCFFPPHGDRSPLIRTGRHFVGLYCHMPLSIPPLIRAAITGGVHTHPLTRQTLALAQSLGLLHAISIPLRCLARRSDERRAPVGADRRERRRRRLPTFIPPVGGPSD